MKPLGMIDAGFLLAERRHQPMHVGGLSLLQPPRGIDPARFAATASTHLLECGTAVPPFNQKPVRRVGLWCWDTDHHFDISKHFKRLTLPAPGRDRELFALVSRLHGRMLDRSKPLWEFYLIDGLADGRVALYGKIHHALLDGLAALRLWTRGTSTRPETQPAPLWTMPVVGANKTSPDTLFDTAAGVLKTIRSRGALDTLFDAARSVEHVGAELTRSRYAHGTDNAYVSFSQAPRSLFNQRVTANRSFAAVSFALARVRSAARRRGVTVNDIALCMSATALRHYLLDHEALPSGSMIAMVPISLRHGTSLDGNQVAMTLANLGTNVADPHTRLELIRHSMDDGKSRARRLSRKELLAYLSLMMSPHGINMALGLDPGWQAFNLIISNVPGPKQTRYWGTAKIVAQHPLSIVVDGAALNITLNSFGEQLAFGLTACPEAVPDLEQLAGYLRDGFEELC